MHIGTLDFLHVIAFFAELVEFRKEKRVKKFIVSTRKRKTRHGVTDFDTLLRAIKAVKIGKQSARSTARAFNIPKSSSCCYIKKVNTKISDVTKIADNDLQGDSRVFRTGIWLKLCRDVQLGLKIRSHKILDTTSQ
ncbi:hypothetical protein ABEB36_009542 [Hypothenemus hampei]|uniref:HTH psq-type domain-containing protein n=1 Tax=Hypothenemus hampei TaxID=57062 RepID=A0ABD1EGX2_HYPHA